MGEGEEEEGGGRGGGEEEGEGRGRRGGGGRGAGAQEQNGALAASRGADVARITVLFLQPCCVWKVMNFSTS